MCLQCLAELMKGEEREHEAFKSANLPDHIDITGGVFDVFIIWMWENRSGDRW